MTTNNNKGNADMNNTIKGYRVSYTIIVDHPERRGPTYPEVAPLTRIHTSETFATQGAAVRYFEGMLAGESDFSSEYVSKVGVDRMYQGRSPRCVRRVVERARPARWLLDYAAKPANLKAWSLTDGTLFGTCERCKAAFAGEPKGATLCEHVDAAELATLLELAAQVAADTAAEKKAA
jgi:hypothetical protein